MLSLSSEEKTVKFLAGEAKPGPAAQSGPEVSLSLVVRGMHMVVVRGLKMNLPPVLGDIEPIKKSKDCDLDLSIPTCCLDFSVFDIFTFASGRLRYIGCWWRLVVFLFLLGLALALCRVPELLGLYSSCFSPSLSLSLSLDRAAHGAIESVIR